MRIGKENNKKIVRMLWKSFMPMHEHLGFDKAITIKKIVKRALKCINVTKSQENNPYFLELFTAYIGKIILKTISNPKSKKWYLRGLLCETIQESPYHRIGYYYFPQNKEEYLRIKHLGRQKIRNTEIKFNLRVVEGGSQHLKQLGYSIPNLLEIQPKEA